MESFLELILLLHVGPFRSNVLLIKVITQFISSSSPISPNNWEAIRVLSYEIKSSSFNETPFPLTITVSVQQLIGPAGPPGSPGPQGLMGERGYEGRKGDRVSFLFPPSLCIIYGTIETLWNDVIKSNCRATKAIKVTLGQWDCPVRWATAVNRVLSVLWAGKGCR